MQLFFVQNPTLPQMVHLSNVSDMYTLSFSDFKAVEPDYALPENAIGVQWSQRDGQINMGFWFPGNNNCVPRTDLTWDPTQYLNNIAAYRAYVALQLVNNANPFFRATDVATARQIAVKLINNYFETNLTTMLEDTTLAGTAGQSIFLLSLIEAVMFTMDSTNATPLIDAQLLPSQNKTAAIEQIIATKNRFVSVLNQLKNKKTTLFGLMDPAITSVSDVITYVNLHLDTTYSGAN